MNQPEVRNDAEIQKVVKAMFLGIAPERAVELEGMWTSNDLRFNVVADNGRDGKFVIDAGCYRDIRFNHRVMRAFWVAAFAAWEGYRICAENSDDLTRFKQLLECVENILQSSDPEQVQFPIGVPPPGTLEGIPVDQKASADLAIFAVGWALLHEVRHIQHQRQNTSASEDDSVQKREEELSCDEFATKFILDKIDEYASVYKVDIQLVMNKRQAGIHFALFAMTVMTRGYWEVTESHPAMQDRINQVWILMQARKLSVVASGIAVGSFYTLDNVWKGVPRVPEELLLLQFEANSR